MLIHWGCQGLSAEAQASEVRPWGEDWAWLHKDSLRGLGYGVPQPKESGKKPEPTRGKAPLLGVCARREAGLPLDLLSLHTLRCQGTTYTSYGGRCEPQLPSWTPEAGADHCCCQGSCEWVQVTAPTFLGVCTAHQHQGSHDLVPTSAPASSGVHAASRLHQGTSDPGPTIAPISLGACMTHHCCQGSHDPGPTTAPTSPGIRAASRLC